MNKIKERLFKQCVIGFPYSFIEYDPKDAKFHCNNGASISSKQLCLYDRDFHGVLLGCRDGSHLQECGMKYIMYYKRMLQSNPYLQLNCNH